MLTKDHRMEEFYLRQHMRDMARRQATIEDEQKRLRQQYPQLRNMWF